MFLRGELPSLAEWRAASGSGAEEASAAEVDPLRTPLEEKLARLWNEVLGIEAKDRREDFFTSGGQSLRASQLAARIRDEFGIDVPMQVLFQRPTIAEQAEWLQIAIDASPTGPRVRHEILRTTFPDDHGRPARRIATTVKIPFACVDLRHKRPGEREADLQRRLRSEAARPFDLAAGPLVRCFVYRLGEQEHVVLLAMHHIICDGWSMGLLLRELGGIYRGLRVCSESSPLPLDGRGAGGEGGWNSEAIRRPLTPNPSPASGRGELLEQTADYIEYADFAAWQKERIAADAFASQLEYWQRQLDGLPPLLELPTDRPRPPQQSFAGSLRKMAISRGTLARLDALARQEKTTRFVVLMAAYNALLNRYSRQEDIAVGTIVANRTRRELENLPGFFANTVVLRTDVSGAPTFRELIARVHRATLEAYANQEVPFEKVVERLQPERFGNRPPLFQVALVLENMPLDLKSMRAWRIERLAIDNGTAKYDLAVLLWEEADQLRGEVEYSTALFDAATVDGMIEALGTLLDAAVQEPDRPVSRLPLVSASLRQRIVSDASDSETHEPLQGLHELFEGQAAATPERIALVCGTRRLSYGELNGEAERVAALLQSRGLRPGEPATVCLPRSAESVIAVLGVLKAGGVYVPLDPDQPAERIAFLLADSGTRLLLARDDLRSRLPATDARVVLWEEIQEEVPSPPAPLPARERGDDSPPAPLPTRERGDDSPPDTLAARERGDVIASPAGPVPARERGARVAYILYTSGSTGRPKGAMVEHRGVVNFVRAFSRSLRITPDDRVLHSFSPSSDGSLSDVFSALASGACLVVADRETVLAPGGLEELVRREHVSVATLTPSMMTLLRPETVPELRTVCSVGEPIAAPLAARWAVGRRLVNGYGLTETAIGVSLSELTGLGPRPTIGRPLANVQVYLLDSHLEPVSIGAVGEICIGGIQVGCGYVNLPELTAARFVADPFRVTKGDSPDFCGVLPQKSGLSLGARLYRSGDLGRLRADGAIELVGRMDDQVKIRGFRVEPSEIAAVLEEHPDVAQAAVVLREDRPGERQLVAYVVPRRAGEPPASQLGLPTSHVARWRAHLRARLPAHMVPSRFVTLEALPRTVQGKIDRRRLPPPEPEDAGATGRVAPRDEHEALVAGVWEEVLGVRGIGCEDDFFALGGHSLLAVRVMAAIAERTGRRLPLAALFQEATVAHLAQLLRNPSACAAESILVPLQPLGAGRPFFCIHPAGGTVFCYRALAEHLGRERPFYGLQALGVDGNQAPHTRVEDMVADYIAAIRSVQPHGPYLLGGWSLGGNLAFETARQLSLQGEEIARLALFDAGALHADRGPTEDDFLPMIMALFPDETNLPLDEVRKLRPPEQLRFFLQRAVQAEVVADDADLRAGGHVFEVFKTSMEAILQYRQQPFAGRVTLFAAEHREDWFGSRRDPRLGWDAWAAGGVEVHQVPGGHLHMVLEPHVRVLAETVRACLKTHDR